MYTFLGENVVKATQLLLTEFELIYIPCDCNECSSVLLMEYYKTYSQLNHVLISTRAEILLL